MARTRDTSIPALDGVRGVALFLVVWSHIGTRLEAYGAHLPGVVTTLTAFSFCGVDLFFVLSGFLLFLPYARAILGHAPWPSTRRFFARRMRRILPAYYAVLAAILALLALAQTHAVAPGGYPLTPGTVFQSLFLLYDFTPRAYATLFFMDGPLWSLTVEWQFYLVLPLLGLGLARFCRGGNRARRLFLGLSMLGLVSLGIRLVATRSHYALAPASLGMPSPWTIPYALVFGINGKSLDVFALGMLAATIYVLRDPAAMPRTTRTRLLLGATGLLGVLGLALCVPWAARSGKLTGAMTNASIVFPRDPAQWPWAVWGDWALGLGFACLLLAVLFIPTVGRLLAVAPLRFLGRVSYSIYVWHLLLLNLLPARLFPAMLPAPLMGWLEVLILWGLVIAWGAACYFQIERPFLRPAKPLAVPSTTPAIKPGD